MAPGMFRRADRNLGDRCLNLKRIIRSSEALIARPASVVHRKVLLENDK
jgi:hypothetical protein